MKLNEIICGNSILVQLLDNNVFYFYRIILLYRKDIGLNCYQIYYNDV